MWPIFLDEKSAIKILVLSIFRKILLIPTYLKNVIQLVWHFWHLLMIFLKILKCALFKKSTKCFKNLLFCALFSPSKSSHSLCITLCTPLCAFSQRKSDLYFSFLLLTEFRCANIWRKSKHRTWKYSWYGPHRLCRLWKIAARYFQK